MLFSVQRALLVRCYVLGYNIRLKEYIGFVVLVAL